MPTKSNTTNNHTNTNYLLTQLILILPKRTSNNEQSFHQLKPISLILPKAVSWTKCSCFVQCVYHDGALTRYFSFGPSMLSKYDSWLPVNWSIWCFFQPVEVIGRSVWVGPLQSSDTDVWGTPNSRTLNCRNPFSWQTWSEANPVSPLDHCQYLPHCRRYAGTCQWGRHSFAKQAAEIDHYYTAVDSQGWGMMNDEAHESHESTLDFDSCIDLVVGETVEIPEFRV